ncbi:hypothetical protein [Robertmurraya sp.]|uniref:hypothetical protein n=1 Tax=Robertmurraya sp. TaxID=2837525 RepID=UPI0037046948
MNYEKFCEVQQEAWDNFLDIFAQSALNRKAIEDALHDSDAFNDVQDAILSAIRLECE